MIFFFPLAEKGENGTISNDTPLPETSQDEPGIKVTQQSIMAVENILIG